MREDDPLRTIAGLEQATEGDVLIGGHVVNGLPPRARQIAMVFQSYALYPHKTVLANIEFPLKAERMERGSREAKVPSACSASSTSSTVSPESCPG